MLLTKIINPSFFPDLEQIRRELNELFDTEFSRQSIRNCSINYPPMSVAEGENNFYVYLFASGFKAEDFDVTMQDNVLSITCERSYNKNSENNDKKVYYRNERPYGKFTRAITLPDTANADDVSAQYKDGILVVTIGKKKENAARKIEVK